MSNCRSLLRTIVLVTVAFGNFATASEPGHNSKLQISIIPRRAASARDRASEVVQKTPEFSLWDRNNKVTPSGAGHVYLVEQIDGEKLLVMDMNEGLRGWVSSGTVLSLDQAETFFTQQIQSHREGTFSYLMRGVVRYEADDLDRAVLDLDAALRLDPKYVPALIERAYLWQWRNHLDDAVADVSKAIELDPRNSYAFVERGVFEYNKKEYDKAQRDFQTAIDMGSRTAVIYIARGMIFLHKHDTKNAHAELKHAQDLDPRHPDVYAAFASMFLTQGKLDMAKKVLDQAVEFDPLCADSHGNRAVVLSSLGQYDKAIDDLDEVVKVAPNSVRALRERAWILATCPDAKVRNGEQAVGSATRACELTDWKDPHCLCALAAAHSESGQFEEAVKSQQKAIDLLDDKSPEQHEYHKVLDRYKVNKPYYRLSLLEEIGVPIHRPPAKKSD
jgi:tetratricopeptide (TPR) repeat protein